MSHRMWNTIYLWWYRMACIVLFFIWFKHRKSSEFKNFIIQLENLHQMDTIYSFLKFLKTNSVSPWPISCTVLSSVERPRNDFSIECATDQSAWASSFMRWCCSALNIAFLWNRWCAVHGETLEYHKYVWLCHILGCLISSQNTNIYSVMGQTHSVWIE